jgi:hypothetical protein
MISARPRANDGGQGVLRLITTPKLLLIPFDFQSSSFKAPRRMQRECAAGRIDFDAIRPRILSWIGHVRHADTYRLRADLFRRMPFQWAAAKSSPASGRDVHQSTGERPLGEPQQERAVEP